MPKRCLILAGGDCCKIAPSDREGLVIACDSGYRHALAAGITPDVLLGDFDSYTMPLPADIPILHFPVDKDDTDTMLAVRHALQCDCDDLVLYGALGGRLDHAYANLQAAAFAAEHGAAFRIMAQDNVCYALHDSAMTLDRVPGYSVSLLAHSQCCVGVNATGLKYPVEDLTLENTFPLGVSNAFAAEQATIRVKEGTLLVILSKL